MKRSANFISYKLHSGMAEKKEETQQSPTDEEVKKILHSVCARIEAPEHLKDRIDGQIGTLKKEERSMGRFSMKKVAVGVAVSCLLVGTICIAGSGIKNFVGGHSTIPDYTEFGDLPKAEAQAGFEMDAVEEFHNGFALTGIYIGERAVKNEAGQEEAREKDIMISYAKGGEDITFMVRELFPGESVEDEFRGNGSKKVQAGDVTFYYSQYTQKTVPVDYELTEEDKAGMEDGSLNVGYGSSEVEMNRFDYVGWVKDGKLYAISGFDLSLSGDDLLGMAKEIVENGN